MQQPQQDREAQASGRALWQRSAATDAPAEEDWRLLDIAAFAEGRLDPDERERVAALLARDPLAAADVAAARTLAGIFDLPPHNLDRIVVRASGLVPEPPPRTGVISLLLPRRRGLEIARWGSLAAAVALASWLGFAMGRDASLTYQADQPNAAAEDGVLPELLDPGTGFLRDLSESMRT